MSEENNLLLAPDRRQAFAAHGSKGFLPVKLVEEAGPGLLVEPHTQVEPVITVEHLVKRYKKAESNAVDDVSFHVKPGSFFTLLGPNGAGKSTIISILTTTLSLTSGTVLVAG